MKFLRRFRKHELVVALVAAGLFLPSLAAGGLWDPWETHYAEVAREILDRGEWLTLHFADNDNRCKWARPGEVFYSKPPLPFWLMAVAYLIFGVSDFAARLPFALAAIAALAFFFYVVRSVWDTRRAYLATAVLATAPLFVMIGRQALVDMLFQACLIGSLGSFVLFAHGPRGKLRYLYGFYVFAALATMTKGLPGVGIPGGAVLLYSLVTWDLEVARRLRLLSGPLLFLLIALPWHLYMYWGEDGQRWYNEYVIFHHFTRGEKVLQGAAEGGVGYYLGPLLRSLYPWVALLPAALAYLLLGRREPTAPLTGRDTFAPAMAAAFGPDRQRETPPPPPTRIWGDPLEVRQRRAVILAACWALVWLLVIGWTETKFNHYVFPLLPPLALIIGVYLGGLGEGRTRGAERLLLAAGLGLLVLVSRDLLVAPCDWAYTITYDYTRAPLERLGTVAKAAPWLPYLAWAAGVLVALLVLGWLRRLATWGLVGVGLVLAGGLVHGFLPAVSPAMGQANAWAAYEDQRQPGDRIYNYRMIWRGEVWYSRDSAPCVKDQTALRKVLAEPGRIFFVTTKDGSKDQKLKREYRAITRRSLGRPINDRTDNYVMFLHEGPAVAATPAAPPAGVVLDAVPAGLTAEIGAHLGERVELVGYRLDTPALRPERTLDLTLYWKVEAGVGGAYEVFLHGEQSQGRCLIRDVTPADGRYATTAWTPGQVVADRHRLVLSKRCQPGELKLYTGLFNDGGRLKVAEKNKTDGRDRILLGVLTVQAAE